MKLDPTKMKDWQIAEAAEETLKPAAEQAFRKEIATLRARM